MTDDIDRAAGWSMAFGIVMILLGVAAISFPLATSVAAAIWIAWLLVIAGAVLLVHAFASRGQHGFGLKLLWAIVYLAAGLLLLANPLSGVLTLTLLLAIFWIVEGAVAIVLALRLRPRRPWGWILFDGALTLLLGLLIWAQWPSDAPWLVGLFLGISLIATGVSVVMFSWALKSGLGSLRR